METPRDKIFNALRQYFPDVKESTLNSYTSTVKSLLAYMNEKYGFEIKLNPVSFEVLRGPQLISVYISSYEEEYKKPMPETTRRNIYSILYRMFPDIIEYKVGFDEAVKIIRSKDPNVKSEREEQNWITKEEIKSIYDSMYEKYKPILKSKQTLTANEIADLSNFILLAVSSGILISPRRSMDWTEMKIRNYSTEDNYYHQGKFYFNKYKTGSVYGTQILPAPKQLRDIMKWYIEKNPNDYLLVNHFGTKLGESSITPRLNKIFGGKKISTTMLRHIYLSDYHKNTPALSEMTKVAHDMGHSITMGLEYVKR